MNLRRILKAVFACFLWSTAFVGIKIGLKYSSPFSFAGFRFMIAGVILFLFNLLIFRRSMREYMRDVSENISVILKVSLFQTFLLYALFYSGLTLVSGALAAIIVGVAPLNSAIVAHITLKNDRMTLRKTLSIVGGIVGVVIIALSRKPWSLEGFSEFIGVIILYFSSVSGAFGNVIVAKARNNLPALTLASSQLFIGGFALFLISIPLEGLPSIHYPTEFYVALAWLSILSAVAFTIWFSLLKQAEIKVSDLNLWKFIIPIFGAVLAWLILPDEHPSFSAVIGMTCVSLSILTYYFNTKRERKAT